MQVPRSAVPARYFLRTDRGRRSITSSRCRNFMGTEYEQFVGTRCIGTTRLEFVEIALSPAYFWVGASRVHDRSDGAVASSRSRTIQGMKAKHDRRFGHSLRARGLAFFYGGTVRRGGRRRRKKITKIRRSTVRGVRSAEGVGMRTDIVPTETLRGREKKSQLERESTRSRQENRDGDVRWPRRQITVSSRIGTTVLHSSTLCWFLYSSILEDVDNNLFDHN